MGRDRFPDWRCPACGGLAVAEEAEAFVCPDCRTVYPVFDGVPLMVADVGAYFAEAAPYWLMRQDLSAGQEDLIGRLLPPGSYTDVSRQHLSSYARDHYGAGDPLDTAAPLPGAAWRLVEAGLKQAEAAGAPVSGPVLDLGCATGGIAVKLAAEGYGPVTGIDLSAPLLRMAARTVAEGTARYPYRLRGTVFERREVPVPTGLPVRFVLGDGLNPPVADSQFGLVVALNLLDCVGDPLALLDRICGLLRPGGHLIVTTPFDWSAAATPPDRWIGARSSADSAPDLAGMLRRREDLSILAAMECPWSVRLHERAAVHYSVSLAVAQRKE
jgi:SAM-dependent methyltransferase